MHFMHAKSHANKRQIKDKKTTIAINLLEQKRHILRSPHQGRLGTQDERFCC
jgi:predicted HTH domain antitoxin